MKLLFVCTGNSCRSQMAEAWARELATKLAPSLTIDVNSAGLEAQGLNPHALSIMEKFGVDMSQHSSDVLTVDMLANAELVVTVCSHADEHCPIIPTGTDKLHMPFQDPAKAIGSKEEVEAAFESVCIEIRNEVADLLDRLSKNYSLDSIK